jgi:hypothetical protein
MPPKKPSLPPLFAEKELLFYVDGVRAGLGWSVNL